MISKLNISDRLLTFAQIVQSEIDIRNIIDLIRLYGSAQNLLIVPGWSLLSELILKNL